MTIEVRNGDGKSPAAIEAELTEAGLHFLALDVPPVENGAHWHDFSSVFYVTKGSVRLTDVESGEVLDVQPGCRVSVSGREDGFLPVIGVRPAVGQVDDRAGLGQRFERGHRVLQNSPVEFGGVGPTRCVPERKVQVGGAGGPHCGRYVTGARHRQCRDPGLFQCPCDQTDGLMADRSNRDQQHRIELILSTAPHQLGNELFTHAPRAVDPAHDGVRVLSERADNSFGDKSTKRIDRKNDVDVTAGIGEVVGEVRSAKSLRIDVRRYRAVRCVVLEVERGLSFDVDSAGSDQPESASAHRPRQ